MDPVVALHPSLRLRRTGGNDANPQLLTHAPKLRHRNFSPQLLGLGRLSLVHVLPIGIERARHSILPNPHPQHFHCRPDGLFFAQTGLRHARGIVYHVHQATPRTTPFPPIMETPVQLHQLATVRLTLPALAVSLALPLPARSEERRVGKDGGGWWV